jgi:lipopolysaccharide/colanic/teichoic acid biosynthesis glycosyltransferase
MSPSNAFDTLAALRQERARATAPSRSNPPEPSPAFDEPSETAAERVRAGATRSFDLVASLLALTALVPLFLIIAVAIRSTSPGPIFYGQTRVGRNLRGRGRQRDSAASGPHDRRKMDRRTSFAHGRHFQIYKFRTMVVNAEEYGPQWSRPDDPRITPVGRFLRKSRLDETPQFYNVLRGDMSILGPRPERPYFVKQFVESIPNYSERLRVRPGITGLAQVTLDYDSSIDDVKKKLEHDLQHVRRKSFRRDLRILARTLYVVLTGKGSC